jgi:DNA-binding transcriptional ArsR family regulator
MHHRDESTLAFLRALSNPHRLTILRWLLDPARHFPPQQDGDLVEDGVCVGFVTRKLGLSQPTVTGHMQILAEAGLVSPRRIKNWVFYKLEREMIQRRLASLDRSLGQAPHKTPDKTPGPIAGVAEPEGDALPPDAGACEGRLERAQLVR